MRAPAAPKQDIAAAPIAHAVLAEVTRGDRVESLHMGTIVVADASGQVLAASGDPTTFAYFRSSAKPFQAIRVIESGAADAFGFTPAELALCCASHHATLRHQHEVATMLGKIGLSPADLKCGAPLPADEEEAARILAGVSPVSPLQCDCSGKHTGMLAVCRHLGYSTADYLDPAHRLQVEIRKIMARVLRLCESELVLATDGCSLPTFGSTIASFAAAFATLASPDDSGLGHESALSRLRDAMVAHPENVAGAGNFVTDLMEVSSGRIVAKSGAEGLICLGIPEASLGIAVRVADGSFRCHPEVVIETLRQLQLMDESFFTGLSLRHPPVQHNHNGWQVGEIQPAFRLEN